MKALLSGTIAAIAAVVAIAGGAGASTATTSPAYVGLGDSVAAGTALADPGTDGYVALVHQYLKTTIVPGLADEAPGAFNGSAISAVNLAVPGETSDSMIGGQLQDAATLIEIRNGNDNPADNVRVITLDIGGNDAFEVVPDCLGGLTLDCQVAVVTMLTRFQTNFETIVGALREAAGPEADIVVMTYFNPLLNDSCVLHDNADTANIILEGGAGLPAGVNDIIRAVASAYGAGVAETSGLLASGDLTTDCHHPNESGHQKIAAAFTAVIDN